MAALVVSAAATVAVTTMLATRPAEVAGSVASRAGGFALRIPEGWRAERVEPIPGDPTFLLAREGGPFGLARAGMWVDRWPSGRRGVDEIAARLADEFDGRHDGLLRERVDGLPALRLTHERRTYSFVPEFLPGGTTRLTEYRIIASDFIYNIGFWTTAPGSFEGVFEDVIATWRRTEPRPRTVSYRDDGFSLEVPAGWTEAKSPLPKTVIHALGPGRPDAWFYVFHYPDAIPEESRTAAAESIRTNGGYDLQFGAGTLGGEPCLRLDFRFPDEHQPDAAYDTEWFLDDGRGGTLVLAVGRRDPTSDVHHVLASSWAVSG